MLLPNMQILKGYIRVIDSFNTIIGKLFSWLTFFLVVIVCYDVFTRYLLQQSSVALQELEWHLFALIFLGAAAYTLNIDDHVRVDVFYTRFSDKTKAWINLLGAIIFLIPFCVIVIMASKNFVWQSFLINETSPDAGGLPGRFLLKAFIPLSFFFLLLQGISLAFKSILIIKQKDLTKEL